VLTYADSLIGKLDAATVLPQDLVDERGILRAVGSGFIMTAMLWGGFLADLLDGRLRRAGAFMLLCAVLTLFGFIHSVAPAGELYLPWKAGNSLTWQIAIGYALVGLFVLVHPQKQQD
jgi:AGZA family xanthine/uracil permease-like MFS transporter